MEARNGGSGALLPGGAPDSFGHIRLGIHSIQAVQIAGVIKQTNKIREGKAMNESIPDGESAGMTKQVKTERAQRSLQSKAMPDHLRPASAEASCPARGRVTPPRLRAGRPSHQLILDAFIAYGRMTPDELAEKIGRSVFYTRPRCSELRAMGLLHRTGEAHINALSGLKAEVLSL